MFFQLRKQVEVIGCQVQTIGWVSDDFPSKPLQESDSLAGSVGSSVIVENAYNLAQHPSSPVLNRPPEFCQCLIIPASVYYGTSSHEIIQQYPLSIQKHSCHYFSGRLCLLQFSRLRRREMQLLTWLLFRFKCVVVCPGFVARDKRIEKSYSFRPHSGGEIHGQSPLVTVCGLLSAFVGPMLCTPSDIATCPSKTHKW